MTTVQTIYDEDHKRRLIVFQRDDSTFGFKEERFSPEPMEMAWIALSLDSACRCDTVERVLTGCSTPAHEEIRGYLLGTRGYLVISSHPAHIHLLRHDRSSQHATRPAGGSSSGI